MNTPTRYLLGATACVGVLFGLWQWAASGQSALLLPGPADTVAALWSITRDGSLLTELALTLGRAALATVIAFGAGVLLGWAAYRSTFADGFLAPVRAVLQGLPPIVFIVVLVLWLGSDPVITVVVCATVMTPLIAAATVAALRGVDPHLMELGLGLQLSLIRRWLFIMVPAAMAPVVAATGAVASGAVRVTVMAELLSAPNGVGAAIAQNRTLLQTPELFAWTVAIVVCALVVDVAARASVRRFTDSVDSRRPRGVIPRSRQGIGSR